VLHVRTHLVLIVILALALPWLSAPLMMAVLLAALAWHLGIGLSALKSLGKGLWRLKWLLLAILAVYAWFPEPGHDQVAWWEAAQRALLLMTLFAWVHTLMFLHPAEKVGAAMAEGLAPLDRLGLPGSRFARCLALLLEEAVEERQRLSGLKPGPEKSWLRSLPRLLAEQIRRIETGSETLSAPGTGADQNRRGFPVLGPSPRAEWALLAGVGLILLILIVF